MTWSAHVLYWPAAGTGTLLVLAGLLGVLVVEIVARALRTLDATPVVALLRVLNPLLVAVGVVVFAGNRLAPPAFLLVLGFAVLLGFANADTIRAVSSTVALVLSRRIRLGDRVRVGDTEGVVTGFYVGWLRILTSSGHRTLPASALIARDGLTIGERRLPPDAACTLAFLADRADDRLEETVRRIVLCSPYLAMGRDPRVVCTWRGASCEVRVRAWALTEDHVDRFLSDVRSRCFALGLRELS